MSEIYGKINAIMKDIPAIGKDRKNKQQGFAYRGIDDVMNVLFPLLARHGVFVIPEVLSTTRTERQTQNGGNMAFTVSTVKYTFFATDGSSVSAITTGEGMDVADKSTNKAMAAAMKYAFFQTFCIPTEDMGHDDPDLETPPESVPMPAQQETPPVIWMCEQCKRAINATKTRTAQQVAESTKARYGRSLCSACANREQRELDAIAAESQHDNAGDDV